MNGGVVFTGGTATAEQITQHLIECDARFIPCLTSRVDVPSYAAKMAASAQRFEAWSDRGLVGLVAAYMNDAGRHEAFITSVSVARECAGAGVATRLLRDCLEAARRKKFLRVSLDVSPANAPALRLYERCGFLRIDAAGAATARMMVDLTDPG